MPTAAAAVPALWLRLVLAALALLLGAGSLALAPEPDPIPRRWQLDVAFSPLRVHTIETKDGPRAFYYLTYRVVNKSGEDRLLAPLLELVVDRHEPVRAGRQVPAEAARTLLERLNDPLILDQISAIGLLKQGVENAREALVAWPADDLRPDSITLYAAGFSGETATVKGQDGKPQLLRKTLMQRYAVSGEISAWSDRPIEPVETRWVMR